jgi:Tfp pilus assembly protein PilO
MDQLKRYLWPIAVGGAVIVVAMIAVLGWIVPEGHNVSQANASKVTLQAQETSLQAEIDGLEHESKHEPANCQNLRQDLQLIPETPTADLFLRQISTLATSSGTQTPSVSITSAGTPGTGPAPGGAETVGIDLSVSGTYHQVLTFLGDLDKVQGLQRLFSVSSVSLSGGPSSGNSAPSTSYSLQLQGDIYYSTTEQNVCQTSAPGASSSAT